jgi:hypothetical protein
MFLGGRYPASSETVSPSRILKIDASKRRRAAMDQPLSSARRKLRANRKSSQTARAMISPGIGDAFSLRRGWS